MSYLAIPLQDDSSFKLHYQVIESKAAKANKATVIFLHGLIMDNMSSWFFTIANPASQYARVLIYDLRGHGFSDRPRTGYTIEDHVADLKALIDAEAGDGPIVLVGNSFGGLLAVNFAATYPDLIQGVILIDAQINDAAWKKQMLGSLDLRGEERDKLIDINFTNWRGRHSPKKANRLADNAIDLAYNTTLIEDLRGAPNIADEVLQRITASVFAIYGEKSDILETGIRINDVLESCDLKIFEGCSHSVLWEQTDAVRNWIMESVQTVIDRSIGDAPGHQSETTLELEV